MRAILDLNRVIYGCTFVTYDGSRQRVRKSRTPQPCPRTAAAVRSSARCGSADGARPQGLSASGLSLSAAGPSFETTSSHRRHQGRFHGEALPRVGATSALVREHHRSVAKRNRQPGVAKRASSDRHAVQLEYRFDRLLIRKLEQVYQLLVPEIRRPVGSMTLNST